MSQLKKLVNSLVVFAILANSAAVGWAQNGAGRGAYATKVKAQEPSPQEQYVPDVVVKEATIDGAKNPEQISDQVAFRLFLRFLSGRTTPTEKSRAKSYLKLVLGGCKNCNQEEQVRRALQNYDTQIDALLAAADEYARRATGFEAEAKKIRDRDGVGASRSDLRGLQKKKDDVALEVVAALPNRIGKDAADVVRSFVKEAFKKRVKINRATKLAAPSQPAVFLRAAYMPVQEPTGSETSTYSDSWIVDNSATTYYPEDDSIDVPREVSGNEVVGVGVTEADMDSEVISVQTTLTSPDGRTATYTSYQSPSYTRAEVALSATLNESETAPPDETWDVRSRHDYRVYRDPYDDPYGGGGMYRTASYGRLAALPYYYIYRAWSYTAVTFSFFGLGMADPIIVERWLYGTYGPVCEYTRRTCTSRQCYYTRVRSFANWQGGTNCAPFLQVYGTRVTGWYWFTACVVAGMRGRSTPGVCY